jgi:hypothetical protein
MQKIFSKIPGILLFIFIFLSLISFWGALVYRLYKLNTVGIVISISISIVSIFFIYKLRPETPPLRQGCAGQEKQSPSVPSTELRRDKENKKTQKQFSNITIQPYISHFIIFISLFIISILILLFNRTNLPIISPWQVLPNYFFIFYAITFLALTNLTIKTPPLRQGYSWQEKQINNLTILSISIFYFLSFSVALIIYKIGYGFDPFIHQSTIDLIAKNGQVLPKPFYYLSQYSLEVILHKVVFINTVYLDKLLVPVLAATTLPAFLYKASQKLFDDHQAALLSILVLLVLPFSFFIVTTPQNFAYLFLLLAIILALTTKDYFDLSMIYLFALVATLSQPIAGIPALFLAMYITVFHSSLSAIKKRIIYSALFVFSAAAIPFSFYLNSKLNNSTGAGITFKPGNFISEFKNIFYFQMPADENIILNFIYLIWFNIKILLALIAGAGIGIAAKYRKEAKIFFIYLTMAGAIILSWLISLFFSFDFLIIYERDNYSDRMLLVSFFLLLPFVFTSFYLFAAKLLKQSLNVKIPFLIFLIFLTGTSLYLSYPRKDNFFDSHEYAVSQTDIDAVRWIESNKRSDDYIVLANQQVSVAALREYGFKKYYNNNSIFYYPIPTGSPNYQLYLDMVYKKPSSETMVKAMDLAGVNEGYFVLNKYWWASPKIVDEAKISADFWKSFDDGQVYVFGYRK